MSVEPTNDQIEAAVRVYEDHGYEIHLPWQGTLDDEEMNQFQGFRRALAAALAVPAPADPDAFNRLALWFMRDLSGMERGHLFRLYGISHLDTRAAQQKAFLKILNDCCGFTKETP